MLNQKMQSSREAGHMVREISQRPDANGCSWEQYKNYMARKGLGLADNGGVPPAQAFSAQDSTQDGAWHVCVALRSIVPKTPGEPAGRPGASRGTRGEAALPAGLPLTPAWVKLQRLDCCSWGHSPHPCSFLPWLWGVNGSY